MEDQWKEDFEEFMKGLCSEISFRELTSELVKNIPSGIPAIGNYFSSALSSYDHALQMKALFRIFQLSKELEEKVEELSKEEIEKIGEIIHILEREARRYEREKLPYRIFHPHQFDEVRTILRFSPEDIRSHIERDVEKVELEDYMIIVGKIGAGKTTTLLKIVERSSPNLIVTIRDNIRAIGAEKLYNIEYLDECVVIWDDIQYSLEEFHRVLPVLKELKNVKFIGSIRSADYAELKKDKYFRETQFKKVDVEELSEKEVEELVGLLESEFEKPLKDLKSRFIRKVMQADRTPFYIVSVFRSPNPFTVELIENLPEDVTKVWSEYFMDLDNSEKCVMKTLRMIRESLGVPATEFVRDLYDKAFHGDFNGFFSSLKSLENKGWISREYFEPEETEIIISKDAQLFCFELEDLEKEDFHRCLYEKTLKPEKFHSIILLSISYLLLSEDDYKELVKVSNKAIELNPKSALAYFGRGHSYFKLKRLDEAIEDLKKAIELDPSDSKFYATRGRIYSTSERFDEAIEDFSKALELDPENRVAYKARGDIYFQLERFDEAIEDFNKAIELGLENAVFYNNRGLTYSKLGKFDEAMEDYKKAIELDPNYVVAYSNRGDLYFQMKRFDEALGDYDEAIMLDTMDEHPHAGRGNVYYEVGRFNEAVREYSEALRISIEKGMFEHASEISKHIFYGKPKLNIEFRIKNGIYACATGYLRDRFDPKLLNDIWIHRSSLNESPEKIIVYFLGGIHGLGEDVWSLKGSMKNEEYLQILSAIIQFLEEETITHELEESILGMKENTTASNLLFLCLKKFLQ